MSTYGGRAGKTVLRMDILPPEPVAQRRRSRLRRADVVEAQFEPVMDRRQRHSRPSFQNDNRAQSSAAGRVGTVALVEHLLSRLSADLFCALVAIAFIGVFAAFGGFTFLFKASQATASTGPLDITHVSLTPQDANGMRVLLINGIVENSGSDTRSMPSIRAELISGDRVVSSTLISPPAQTLDAGHSRGFFAKVPHPGAKTNGKLPDLRLSFAERDVSDR